MAVAGWAAWVVLAATWYVDGDDPECSTGGDAPFCTVQEAFDNPALGPGDEILLRDAAAAYAGGTVESVSGSAASPIVLRPDEGHAPILGGRIELRSSSHWIVRGLTFDGAGTEPAHNALQATCGDDVVNGIVFENNAILDWGGPLVTLPEDGFAQGIISLVSYPSTADATMIDPIVRGNRILDSRGKAISLINVSGGTVESNEIAQMHCQMESNGPGILGIHLSNVQAGTVARNRVRDFAATPCPLGGDLRIVGVWLQNSELAEVHHNLVERMGGQAGVGMGIDLIQNANDSTVHHNVVVDADECGLCNGVRGSGGSDRARFVANTVIGGRGSALAFHNGEDAEFIDNIAVGAGRSQVHLLRAAEIATGGVASWTFENNLYLPAPGKDNIARLEYEDAVDFDAWMGACDCDASSVVADPMLPPGGTENFTAASGSPAVDGGIEVPESAGWNGAAVDLGAVEAPIVVGASIAAAEPDRIRVDLQSETSALRHDPGCSGFTVEVDGAPVAALECELDGQSILVRLAEPVHAGASVTLGYDGFSISNSDAIGGVVHGLLQPFTIEVANGSEQPAPADTGDASSSTGTDGAGADYPGLDGCACSHRPRAWPSWALLLLVALRRRTIA